MSTPTLLLRSLTLFSLMGLVLAVGCSRQLPSQYFRLLAFGTVMELEVIGVDQNKARQAF